MSFLTLLLVDVLIFSTHGINEPISILAIIVTIIDLTLGSYYTLKESKESTNLKEAMENISELPVTEIHLGEKNVERSCTEAVNFFSTIYGVEDTQIVIRSRIEFLVAVPKGTPQQDSYQRLNLIKEFFGAKEVQISQEGLYKKIQLELYKEGEQ